MRRAMMFVLVVASVVSFSGKLMAGEKAGDGEPWVTKTYMVYVAPGEAAAFDAAMKEHVALHQEAGDPKGMTAYQVVVGRNLGSMIFRETAHGWAGFDEEMKIGGDEEHLLGKVFPHVKHISSHIGVWQPKISRWPEDLKAPKLVEVTVFDLNYAGMEDFMHAIKKLHEVIGEKAADWNYSWEMIVKGAGGPQMVLAIPHDSWADFAEPTPSLWQMVGEALGEHEARQIREEIGSSVAREKNFVLEMRPDLSYMPKK